VVYNISMKKVIVTGGAGFIGSNLVDAFVEKGWDVHVIDNLSAGKKEYVNPQATLHVVDIRNREEIEPLFKDVEYVFHLAALPSVQGSIDHPEESHDINVTGTLNVLIAAQKNNVKKVVFTSSAAVYGDQDIMPLREDMTAMPKSPYGVHKFIGEMYCKTWSTVYGLPTVCLRYFNVYGPRFNPDGAYALVIGKFMKLRAEGKPITITGDGTQTRDFVHVADIAAANSAAAESTSVKNGESINIGEGKNYSINKVAELIGGPIEYIPARLEAKDALADITKAEQLLGWKSTISLEKGITELKRTANIV
jgi:UDP-glucose 4-epimerase